MVPATPSMPFAACGVLVYMFVVAQASMLEQRSMEFEDGALHDYIEQSLCPGLDPSSACL